MADIEQVPGTLNITQMVRGEAMSFQTVHDGDLTADTFAATINNAGATVALAMSKTYGGVSLKTTLTYTLSAANSATLVESLLPWKVVQTSGGVARTIIAGLWGVATWK